MIDFEILITGGVGLITTTVSALVSWILARKKYQAEVENTRVGSMDNALDFYTKLCDDNKVRLDDMTEDNAKMKEAYRKLQEDNIELRKEVESLRTQLTNMMATICYNLSCEHRQLSDKKNGTKTRKKIQGQ